MIVLFRINKNQAGSIGLIWRGFPVFVFIRADQGRPQEVFGHRHHFPQGDKAGHFLLTGLSALRIHLILFVVFPDLQARLFSVMH